MAPTSAPTPTRFAFYRRVSTEDQQTPSSAGKTPIIDRDTYEQIQARTATRGANTDRNPKASPRPYALRGVLFCGLCGRRMRGSWNNGKAHYRCIYPEQYALAAGADAHPKSMYLREDAVLPQLDGWLATAFDPDNRDTTLGALVAAAEQDAAMGTSAAKAAQRRIAVLDKQVANYRRALDAGGDAALIAGWINQSTAERDALLLKMRETEERQHRRSPGNSS